MHVWWQTVTVIVINTWFSLVRGDCPQPVLRGWLSRPRHREEEPRASSSMNSWYLSQHLWPGAKAGWVSQTSSGSYLLWCPQHMICTKAARKFKGKKKSLVYNSSALFCLCMTYCNLVWCKKTLVKTMHLLEVYLYTVLASSKIQTLMVLHVTDCPFRVHVREHA